MQTSLKQVAIPQVGQEFGITRTITDEDIRAFARLTGDENPIHLDDVAAKSSRFGQRVAHGMLSASIFSTLLGMHLPGPGTIYLGQTIQFKAPIFVDDVLDFRVQVLLVDERKRRITLRTWCQRRDSNEILIDGEASVLLENT